MTEETFIAPSLEELGEQLPAYEFIDFIAQGGMGAVYRARQVSLDREVAIKVLPRELGADPEFRESFAAEAKAMAKLNHRNLIAVFDFGDVEGMPYIVMEYVAGKSLHHSCWNTKVDAVQAAEIVQGIAEGLGHAHDHGLIHRDIKPANILLNHDVTPKVGDFGLAQSVDSEGPGLVMGTPGFTAPEVLRDPALADKRSDVFSLGAILYELLAGTPPPEDLQFPRGPVGSIPTIDAIWRQAVDPDPARRYADAGAMAKALDAWLKRPKPAATAVTPGGLPDAVPGRPRPYATKSLPSKKGSGSLVRNLILIPVLIGAIVFAYKLLKEETAFREELNAQLADSREVVRTPTAADRPPASGAGTAGEDSPSAATGGTATPGESTADALKRLQAALKSGDTSEFPPGTVSRHGSHFVFTPNFGVWWNAFGIARDHGARLPVPESDEDLEFLAGLVPGNHRAWIGAGSSADGGWSTVDGRPWQPSRTPVGKGPYVTIDQVGVLRAAGANEKAVTIFEWPEQVPATGTVNQWISEFAGRDPLPPGSIRIHDQAVLIVRIIITRPEAGKCALDAGTGLAVLPDPSQRDAFRREADQVDAPNGLWVGAECRQGVWTWADGSACDSLEWAPGEPQADTGGLVYLPGRGWAGRKPDAKVSGFALGWDLAPGKAGEPGTGGGSQASGQGPADPALAELNAKAIDLVRAEVAKRDEALANLQKNTQWELDKALRQGSSSERERWSRRLAEVRLAMKKNPETPADVLVDMATSAGLGEEPPAPVAQAFEAAQQAYDEVEERYLDALKTITRAYLRYRSEIGGPAPSIGGTREALNEWMSSLGLDEEARFPDRNELRVRAFVGRWNWNRQPGTIFEFEENGRFACPSQGRRGTWTLEGGTLTMTFGNGTKIRFDKDGPSYLGINPNGRPVVLTRLP